MGQQGDLGFNSDVDGDLWMHSDSENSAAWTVVVVGSGAGDHSQRETATRTENICFPGLELASPLSAWYVGRDYCHLEVTDEHGVNRRIGSCPDAAVPTPSG